MKTTKKIINIILILMLLTSISSTCFATTVGGVTISDGTPQDISEIQGKVENIVATLRNIAAIISVLILVILGIKYMVGSVEEKAEYKKSFIPLIIGVVVVMASLQIAAMIFSIAQ